MAVALLVCHGCKTLSVTFHFARFFVKGSVNRIKCICTWQMLMETSLPQHVVYCSTLVTGWLIKQRMSERSRPLHRTMCLHWFRVLGKCIPTTVDVFNLVILRSFKFISWPHKNYNLSQQRCDIFDHLNNFALVKIKILACVVTLLKCLYLNTLPCFVLTFIFGSKSCVTPTYFFLQTCLSFSMYSEFMKHRGMGSDLGSPCSHFSFLRSATQHQRRVPRPSICSDSFSLSSPLLFSSPLLIYPFTALPLFHSGCFSLLRPQNFTAHSL